LNAINNNGNATRPYENRTNLIVNLNRINPNQKLYKITFGSDVYESFVFTQPHGSI